MSLFSIRVLIKCAFFTVMLSLASTPLLAIAEIEIEGIDGKQHVFSEYIGKGKWTVLNIWGPKCPPCREEMPDLVQFHDDHKDVDATVVGIAIDFPSYGYAKKKAVVEFAEDFMIDFPILLNDSSITERLGLGVLQGLPTTYVYTPEGNLIGAQVGGITKTILEDFIKKHVKR